MGGYSPTKYKNCTAMRASTHFTYINLFWKVLPSVFSFSLLQPHCHSYSFIFLHSWSHSPSALQRPRSSANHGSLRFVRFAIPSFAYTSQSPRLSLLSLSHICGLGAPEPRTAYDINIHHILIYHMYLTFLWPCSYALGFPSHLSWISWVSKNWVPWVKCLNWKEHEVLEVTLHHWSSNTRD